MDTTTITAKDRDPMDALYVLQMVLPLHLRLIATLA